MKPMAVGIMGLLFLLAVLAACGGAGSGEPPADDSLRPLAYVVTECQADEVTVVAHQKLQIRHGENVVTVRELSLDPLPALGLCSGFAEGRLGGSSILALAFQRLGISPDGSTVVFEVTDDHSILRILLPSLPPDLLPPGEEEGIFAVRADGSGLRRMGDASCVPSFLYTPSFSFLQPFFRFSPDSRRVAFLDLGLGATGEEATQVWTMDVTTGVRQQITHLPPLEPLNPAYPAIEAPRFTDNETIGYWTNTLAQGSVFYTMKADGTGEPDPVPPPAVIPGARIVSEPFITAEATGTFFAVLEGTPVNDIPGNVPEIFELFLRLGEQWLQLTNFQRSDTYGGYVDRDQQRVLLSASTNALGTNPDENCQFFSISTLGSDLRQLTRFGEGLPSVGGCYSVGRPGCYTFVRGRDIRPGPDTVVFLSSCDPLGTNPDGGQIFTMRFDGSELRQLTNFRRVERGDGSVSVELPGPIAYPEPFV